MAKNAKVRVDESLVVNAYSDLNLLEKEAAIFLETVAVVEYGKLWNILNDFQKLANDNLERIKKD